MWIPKIWISHFGQIDISFIPSQNSCNHLTGSQNGVWTIFISFWSIFKLFYNNLKVADNMCCNLEFFKLSFEGFFSKCLICKPGLSISVRQWLMKSLWNPRTICYRQRKVAITCTKLDLIVWLLAFCDLVRCLLNVCFLGPLQI